MSTDLQGSKVHLRQVGEGIVIEVYDGVVECELYDLTDKTNPVEIAEVYLWCFDKADHHLLGEGTVFYWHIGYETDAFGTIRNFSRFTVRR